MEKIENFVNRSSRKKLSLLVLNKKQSDNMDMFPVFSKSKISAVILIFLFPLISINANPFLDNLSWATHGSLLYFAADNAKQGADPAPILPSAGISAAWQFWDYMRAEVTEDLYFTNYEYNSKLNYAMACNPENRSAFVMGFLTGFQLTGYIPILKTGIAARIYGGFALDIRLVIKAFGLNHPADKTGAIETDPEIQTEAIRKYFWSEGRFFYPTAGIGMDFPANDSFSLGFDLRVWFPLYRQWTDQELPAIDGWRFGAGLRITPRKKPPAQEQAQINIPGQTPPRIELPALPQPQPRIEPDEQIDTEAEIKTGE